MTYILGISAYYHDSAACLVSNGEIMAAAQEERFTRKKHDAIFPVNAIMYCLDEGGIKVNDIEYIVFYDKPFLKFERLLETYLSSAPGGFASYVKAMPIWLKEKLYLKTVLRKELAQIANCSVKQLPKLLFTEHHQSHAASAFFASPFEKAAVLCMDGVGEWATTSVWLGDSNKLIPQWQIDFPHSLGLLYSAFTYFAGFKVNSGEYKLMGLAPYGFPKYADIIRDKLLDIKQDGTFRMDMKYFNFLTGLSMTNKKFASLFGGPPRKPEMPITQREMDIAASIQEVTEEILFSVSKTIRTELDVEHLCMAGGVALNCVANGKLLNKKIYKDIWIQPASGDAGGAIGAALSVWYEYLDNRRGKKRTDAMSGAFLGPKFSEQNIEQFLKSVNASYKKEPMSDIIKMTASLLKEGNVIGWFQGRMEFGPRALGGRSILGDPRDETMQTKMNLKIKYRESFRPFAPSVLDNRVSDYFEIEHDSPYMLLVENVKQEHRLKITEDEEKLFGIDKLKVKRSTIPSVTHVDCSARIQTVHENTNPHFFNLLKEFESLTACPMLINTSFNVRGEPIVCTPEDAYRCFMRTEMDYLVIENYILAKKDQPEYNDADKWQETFELD